MKPTDLRILAELLLEFQEDVLKDSHHDPVHDFLLDNSVVKAYAATVELVDYISEEIAILEEAGILEPEPVDPEEEEIFETAMDVIFDHDRQQLKEMAKQMKIDPESPDMPRAVGKKLHERHMAIKLQSRIDRWKDQPSEE